MNIYGIEVVTNPYLLKHEVYLVSTANGKQIVRCIDTRRPWRKSFNRRNRKWEMLKKSFVNSNLTTP